MTEQSQSDTHQFPSDSLVISGFEQLSEEDKLRLQTLLGELGLNAAPTVEHGERPSPTVVTYEDTLAFAGEARKRQVNYAWGSLFGRTYPKGRLDAGIEVVNPDGEIEIGAELPGAVNGGPDVFKGWGVTFDSLARAIDTGDIHQLTDMKHKNSSYKLFADYVNSQRETPVESPEK